VYTGAWDYPSPGARLCTALAEPHEVPVSQFLPPVEVPLNGSSHSSQFCICSFAEGALSPIVQVINEDVKWY